MGFGKYMTGEEIQKFPTLRTAFASLPNVHITTANRLMVSDWAVSGPGLLSGTCPMNVLIDGRFTTWEEAREIPQRLIAAIEVYPRTNSGPFEMLPPSARGCGIFLIWTNR